MRVYRCFLVFALTFGVFCVADCPVGDLDGNCSVGVGDLVIFAGSWLDDPVAGANFDGVGDVDMRDFSIFSGYWGDVGYPLVINEYMSDNEGTIEDPDQPGAYEDWIEIFNYGSAPVDLAGLYLSDSQTEPEPWMIPYGYQAETTVPAGGYLIIWADEDLSQGPLHANFKLSNNGNEYIGLYLKEEAEFIQIDGVSTESQGDDESKGRLPDGSDNWQSFFLTSESSTDKPTPGAENGGISVDSLIVINEIMYHPSSENDLDEYIEIHNRASVPINLFGWSFSQGVDYVFPDITIGSNGFVIIAADTTQFNMTYSGVSSQVIGGWTGKLHNRSESLTLVNELGMLVDTVEYADQGDWSTRLLGPVDYTHRGWIWSKTHDGGGKTLELINPDQPNEYGQNWAASTSDNGSPGMENSMLSSDAPAFITKVKHEPLVPHSDEPVSVSARIINNLPSPATVQLAWRIDQSIYSQSTYPTYDSASYTVTAMTDNGDGSFVATIPAQANNAVVEFFVTAVNADGTRTFPAACDMDGVSQQVANLLYQVDNSFDPTALNPGDQPVYRVVMTQAEHDRLLDIGDEEYPSSEDRSNAQMNATFIYLTVFAWN